MNKIILTAVVASTILLTACSNKQLTVRPIDINKKIEPVEVLHPPLPDGVTWEEVTIVVLTPDKMREILQQIEDGELDESRAVFAALPPDSYESLALNIADLKRFIQDQKSVIMYYRETVPKSIYLPQEEDKDDEPEEVEEPETAEEQPESDDEE